MAQIFQIKSAVPIYHSVSTIGVPGQQIQTSGNVRLNLSPTMAIADISGKYVKTLSYSGYVSSQGNG